MIMDKEEKKQFIGGNISPEVYNEVAKLAILDKRSITAELEVLLEEAIEARDNI